MKPSVWMMLAAGFALSPMAAQAQGWTPPIEAADPGRDGVRIDADGIFANFLPAAGKGRHPAILLLGGSEGGLGSGALRMARGLQAAGFSVLQLSYYRSPGQPENFASIPLETFDRGLAWLKARKDVNAARIGVVGASKGAEAALIVGSRHPEVKAIVAGMPSAFAWPAFGFGGPPIEGASWSLNGVDLPSLPYGPFDPATGLLSIYANGLKDAGEHPDAVIPVEKARGAILLVCGMDDRLWPACPMADMVKTRAPRAQVLAYPDAGHAVFGLPLADDDAALPSLASLGGTPQGNNAARKDGWPRVIAFLKKALGT